MDLFEIGREIQLARKALKPPVTQAEIAAELDMSPATISQIENGLATEVSLRRLMRVMERVGLEIVARPVRMGYTLDDAKDELRGKGMKP